MTTNDCSICLILLKDNIVKPYGCSHEFHSDCISLWNGSCPICRNQVNHNHDHDYCVNQYDEQCLINITIMENIYKKLSNNETNIYKINWKIRSCVNDNHDLIFIHTYGVLGICKTCNRIEPFNLMH